MDWYPLYNSLRIAAISSAVVFFAGIAAAYYAARLPRTVKGFLDVLLTLPMVLPPTVCGYFLIMIFGVNRPVGKFLLQYGVKFVMTWYGGALAASVVAFPLMYRTARGAFESFDMNLAYSGQTLGLSDTYIFWRIRMPACRQGIIAGAVLAFARALGEYGATSMLIGYTPGRTATIATTVYQLWRTNDERGAFIWVMVNLAISAAVLLAVNLLEDKQRRGMRPLAPQPPLIHADTSPRTEPQGGKRDASSPPSPLALGGEEGPCSLHVDIEKRLGDFHLRVAFEGGGETVGLLGASGCGKSMTLKCIAGIERPDRGRIVLDGETLFDSEARINLPPQRRRVGYLFQNYALFPNMTVRQNVLCGLHRDRDRARKEAILSETLAMLQLTDLADHRPSQLSGGQAQRTALARILVNRPRLLMLDEPFSALDSCLRLRLQMQLRDLLRNYGRGVLLVTHDRNEAYHMCGRIAMIDGGRLLTVKGAKEFFADPGSIPAAIISGCKNVAEARKVGEHEVEVPAWGLCLATEAPVREGLVGVGIRAHYFNPRCPQNRRPVLFVREMEQPFEWVIEFRFRDQPPGSEPLWWRLPKDKKPQSFPGELGVSGANVLLLYDPVHSGQELKADRFAPP